MKILSVNSPEFKRYGKVLEGYDFKPLCNELKSKTPMPKSGFDYSPSIKDLECLDVFEDIKNRGFGGMPTQIGYCNGKNKTLNCLEYHKTSEFCIAATPLILMLGAKQDIENGVYDSSKVEIFLLPEGVGVELYATTLHYAPYNVEDDGFFMACALPLGTNAPAPKIEIKCDEDYFVAGTNKWLLVHKDAPEAKGASKASIVGENITLA